MKVGSLGRVIATCIVFVCSAATVATAAAGADSTSVYSDSVGGSSPNGLGTWTVDYQKVSGGDPAVADAVNRILDDEANGQVWVYAASASKTSPWTYHSQGTLAFRPLTIAAVYLGQYNATELPNMPVDTVATRVFDSRNGNQIVWENLFTDEQAGLDRLAAQTAELLPVAYPQPQLGGWSEYSPSMAAVERTFQFWVPTASGIELHFPDRQFGRGLRVITVPWAAVRDVIAPDFVAITR